MKKINVSDVADLLFTAAERIISERSAAGDDPVLILRGSLMYALLQCEMGNGVTRAELIASVTKMYDSMYDATRSQRFNSSLHRIALN